MAGRETGDLLGEDELGAEEPCLLE